MRSENLVDAWMRIDNLLDDMFLRYRRGHFWYVARRFDTA
jgi:hypothetical protein